MRFPPQFLDELRSRLPVSEVVGRSVKLRKAGREWKGLSPDVEEIVLQDYFDDGSGREPRYYQRIAINASIEAIAHGQNRLLLVMATGTGKTYTAFQIIWRLWKAGRKKRVLYLADRNVLIDQTMVNDFRPFKGGSGRQRGLPAALTRRNGGPATASPASGRKPPPADPRRSPD